MKKGISYATLATCDRPNATVSGGVRVEDCRRCKAPFIPATPYHKRCEGCRFPRCPDCLRGLPANSNGLRCRRCWIKSGRGRDDQVILPTRPARPTRVLPGVEKVAVLLRRYERGESLFHPNDARHEE